MFQNENQNCWNHWKSQKHFIYGIYLINEYVHECAKATQQMREKYLLFFIVLELTLIERRNTRRKQQNEEVKKKKMWRTKKLFTITCFDLHTSLALRCIASTLSNEAIKMCDRLTHKCTPFNSDTRDCRGWHSNEFKESDFSFIEIASNDVIASKCWLENQITVT